MKEQEEGVVDYEIRSTVLDENLSPFASAYTLRKALFQCTVVFRAQIKMRKLFLRRHVALMTVLLSKSDHLHEFHTERSPLILSVLR